MSRLLKSAAIGTGMRVNSSVSLSASALYGRPPPSGPLLRGSLGPQVVVHAASRGPARNWQHGAGRDVAVPPAPPDQVLALAEPHGPSRLPLR